ncbi:MAG: carboxypeptidase-like regulatory domain-containing protein [Hyphomicrobiales bacterium]
MLRNLLFTLALLLTANAMVFAQQGSLQGKVKDKKTGETLPFVNIVVKKGGALITGVTSDFDGNYVIKPLDPGKYTLEASFVGYNAIKMAGVLIATDQITFQNLDMISGSVTLDEVVIVDYKVPIINKDATVSKETVTAEEIAKMPNRTVSGIVATAGGVVSNNGKRGSVRGAKSSSTVIYIDGIPVIGNINLPLSALEQVDVLLSGISAMYGDATGGIISGTSKGPSRKFAGNLGFETSKFLDRFGYYRGEFGLSGPLIKGKENKNRTSILGFSVHGEFSYREDGSPFYDKLYRVSEDKLKDLENNPIRIVSYENTEATKLNAQFLRKSDLTTTDQSLNTSRWNANVISNVGLKINKNINMGFSAQYNRSKSNNFNYSNSLMNWDKNSISERTYFRGSVKLTHKFPNRNDSTSILKNVYYTVHFGYDRLQGKSYDPYHKDDFFSYGYNGKYLTHKAASYQKQDIEIDGKLYLDKYVLNSWDNDTLVEYTRMGDNPLISNMIDNYYEYNKDPEYFRNFDALTSNNCPINGYVPSSSIYGMYYIPGSNSQDGYSEYLNQQYSGRINGSASIGNHEIKLGFEYRQNINRSFSVGGNKLWNLMRDASNFHISELDIANPQFSQTGDTIFYSRKYNSSVQRTFDKSLRQSLGLDIDGLDYLMIDSYDKNNGTINYYDKNGKLQTANLKKELSLDMFSADELINDNNGAIFYRGYTYYGDIQEESSTLNDFLLKKDGRGDLLRPIDAFKPVYMAGYIQDKFSFADLIFNVGVRVDYFDANQKILKDPYIVYPYYTVEDIKSNKNLGLSTTDIPGNIPDGAAVYIDNRNNVSKVTGYRVERNWYNAEGIEITDPNDLDFGSGIQPYTVEKNENLTLSEKGFKDYDPSIIMMPRISFSFPISDEASFFAHYDIYTQRPGSNNIFSPLSYLFASKTSSISNPDLRPEQTIDYALGFEQALSKRAGLKIETYYKEIRDEIQGTTLVGAFPQTYSTLLNLDNATVKGITFTYDQRRSNNLRLKASYTLQFAEATKSNVGDVNALISAGLPYLRNVFPRTQDQRHIFKLSLDYRYGQGENYNGPRIKRKNGKSPIRLLENAGFNFTFTGGSGLPYTASRVPNRNLLKGSYRGSRLPWSFWLNVRFDKDFYFSGKDGKSRSFLNAYLTVSNLLNSKNIVSVYSATGNPDDDGYLAAPEYQQAIQSQTDPQSFRELYSIHMNNPGNYASPRTIRLGFIYNF